MRLIEATLARLQSYLMRDSSSAKRSISRDVASVPLSSNDSQEEVKDANLAQWARSNAFKSLLWIGNDWNNWSEIATRRRRWFGEHGLCCRQVTGWALLRLLRRLARAS